LIQLPLNQLRSLQEQREEEIDEEMENQAELKFKTIMDVKKKFNIKIALATKQGNAELAQEHKETQSSEI
jgi:hypothetical protein